VCLLADGCALAGHDDGSLILWDVDARAVIARWEGAGPSVRGLAVTEDGWLAIVASVDRRIRVLDLRSREEAAAVFLESSPCSMAFARDKSVLLIGNRFGSVYCLRYVEVDP
jgi:WD40 repeat protein